MHLDFETASDADLKVVGLYNYLTHPSTRVILAAWTSPVDGSIQQRDFLDGFDDLRRDIEAASTIHAWNSAFEWGVLNLVLKWVVPLEKMRCTMAHALYRSFPAKLDQSAQVILGRGKMKHATRLLKLFCMGKGKAKPGDWELFCEYNREDVAMERDIHAFLLDNHLTWPDAEVAVWQMAERINWRGVEVNVDDCRLAQDVHQRLTEIALAEIKGITGVENPNSPTQLCQWLDVHSLDKKVLPRLLENAEGDRRRVLELRQQVALSAPKKYTVAIEQANGGVLRNMLQYSGAGRTHRWAGRGLQPQNLRRGLKSDESIADAWKLFAEGRWDALKNPFEMLANLVRSVIMPPDPARQRIGVADYSSIEVVMLHWGAGDEPMLQALRDGLDPYKVFASNYFAVPIEEVTKEQRTFSKPVVLGCGYGLGASTLVEYAEGMGVKMTMEQAVEAVAVYRQNNPLIVQFWKGLEGAMKLAIRNPGKVYSYGHFRFKKNGRATLLRVPGGTTITYWDAEIRSEETQYGLRDKIVYQGVDQYSGKWGDIYSWGGKLVENVTQKISRDVLVYGLGNAVAEGIDVMLHVHDEIVALLHAADELDKLVGAMEAPPWCADAPIHAAAFSCPRYRKD